MKVEDARRRGARMDIVEIVVVGQCRGRRLMGSTGRTTVRDQSAQIAERRRAQRLFHQPRVENVSRRIGELVTRMPGGRSGKGLTITARQQCSDALQPDRESPGTNSVVWAIV
jgi:hypothetical protein